MRFPIWKPTLGSVEDAVAQVSLALGSGPPYRPEKPAQDLSDQIREAFAAKCSPSSERRSAFAG